MSNFTETFASVATKASQAEELVIEQLDLKDLDIRGMETKVTEVLFASLLSFIWRSNGASLKIKTPNGYSILAMQHTEDSNRLSIPHLYHSTGGVFIPSPELSRTKAIWLIARAIMVDVRNN